MGCEGGVPWGVGGVPWGVWRGVLAWGVCTREGERREELFARVTHSVRLGAQRGDHLDVCPREGSNADRAADQWEQGDTDEIAQRVRARVRAGSAASRSLSGSGTRSRPQDARLCSEQEAQGPDRPGEKLCNMYSRCRPTRRGLTPQIQSAQSACRSRGAPPAEASHTVVCP
jgi:hypothetical protein